MKHSKLEQEALRLSAEDRADLAAKLLLSLETGLEEGVADDWLREVQRRADEIDNGRVKLVPASEVRRRVRDLIG
ncbi:MAG: addiction module protein [Wenzhouxiangella sp.]|jgi:putative addiction module component (TIGR02574 family)|nr:addiction module protein [Wenzhouxiangella sp.]